MFLGLVDVCSMLECEHYAKCENKDGIETECVCPLLEDCPDDVNKVCGSDGRTYDNECQLRAVSCLKRKEITPEYNGTCGE